MNECPSRTLPTGEQECPSCGVVWDRADGPPNCSVKAKEQREGTAREELARIRGLLGDC